MAEILAIMMLDLLSSNNSGSFKFSIMFENIEAEFCEKVTLFFGIDFNVIIIVIMIASKIIRVLITEISPLNEK